MACAITRGGHHSIPRYGRKLTREEAREILANLTGFFEILLEWDREAKAAKAATITTSDALAER